MRQRARCRSSGCGCRRCRQTSRESLQRATTTTSCWRTFRRTRAPACTRVGGATRTGTSVKKQTGFSVNIRVFLSKHGYLYQDMGTSVKTWAFLSQRGYLGMLRHGYFCQDMGTSVKTQVLLSRHRYYCQDMGTSGKTHVLLTIHTGTSDKRHVLLTIHTGTMACSSLPLTDYLPVSFLAVCPAPPVLRALLAASESGGTASRSRTMAAPPRCSAYRSQRHD